VGLSCFGGHGLRFLRGRMGVGPAASASMSRTASAMSWTAEHTYSLPPTKMPHSALEQGNPHTPNRYFFSSSSTPSHARTRVMFAWMSTSEMKITTMIRHWRLNPSPSAAATIPSLARLCTEALRLPPPPGRGIIRSRTSLVHGTGQKRLAPTRRWL